MTTITVRQANFEMLFNSLVARLGLAEMQSMREKPHDEAAFEELHRRFIYEIHQFRRELEENQ